MFKLMQLPFEIDDLNPIISANTINFHYGKHHSTYVDKLNEIMSAFPEKNDWTLEQILTSISTFPQNVQTLVLNQAGQVFNHNLYWNSLTNKPENKVVSEKLLELINKSFDSLENFYSLFHTAGMTQFGSGWVTLTFDPEKDILEIEKTANGNTPAVDGKKCLMTMDVWEHAYYLDYQNKRGDYIKEFFKIINWQNANTLLEA